LHARDARSGGVNDDLPLVRRVSRDPVADQGSGDAPRRLRLLDIARFWEKEIESYTSLNSKSLTKR
jgi:hypothetical protein